MAATPAVTRRRVCVKTRLIVTDDSEIGKVTIDSQFSPDIVGGAQDEWLVKALKKDDVEEDEEEDEDDDTVPKQKDKGNRKKKKNKHKRGGRNKTVRPSSASQKAPTSSTASASKSSATTSKASGGKGPTKAELKERLRARSTMLGSIPPGAAAQLMKKGINIQDLFDSVGKMSNGRDADPAEGAEAKKRAEKTLQKLAANVRKNTPEDQRSKLSKQAEQLGSRIAPGLLSKFSELMPKGVDMEEHMSMSQIGPMLNQATRSIFSGGKTPVPTTSADNNAQKTTAPPTMEDIMFAPAAPDPRGNRHVAIAQTMLNKTLETVNHDTAEQTPPRRVHRRHLQPANVSNSQ